MPSRLSQWCDGLIEAGWLIAIVVIPLFFNIHSDRVFEPDKLTLLRSLTLFMIVAWVVRFIDQEGWRDLNWLRWRSDNAIRRMPFVLPVFLLVIIYLFSTLFSVTPAVSWAGSYQRLQGTYTTLSYIVIFALAASTIRSWEQVQRVVTTVIITSIPIAFYGLLQHFGLDPLPWGGNVQVRVAGHMGNSIFIGAYLIMVMPLTAARIIESFTNILSDEELSYADVIRSSIYIFTLAIQVLTLIWTRSRGPFVGIGVGMFVFGLIVLVSLRNAAPEKRRLGGVDFLWTLLLMAPAVAALFVASGLQPSLGAMNSFLVFIGGVSVVVLAIVVLVAIRRGWQWLWLSWILLAVFLAGWFALFNLPGEITDPYAESPAVGGVLQTLDAWREIPEVGRLGRILEADSATGRVRVLIWEGVLELITPHEPLQFPDGTDDSFNVIRPLIGYGPESMYVAYNRFYPPELATVEARNASPDRSHNETFDALVITGGLGFLVWQILYISVFYYGFRWLGVIRSNRDRNILIVLYVLVGVIASVIFTAWRGPEFIGVALPFGSIGGLLLYLVYYALTARPEQGEDEDPFEGNRLLMVGLVAAVTAHFIEIHFGIAIAATRLHFFMFVGLMFAMGYLLPRLEAERGTAVARSKGKRRRRTTSSSDIPTLGKGWRPVLFNMFILMLVVGTLGYEFMTYSLPPDKTITTAADLTTGEIFRQSLFINTNQDFADSPFVFIMIVLAWGLGILLTLSEMVKNEEFSFDLIAEGLAKNRRQITAVLYLVVGLAGLGWRFLGPPSVAGDVTGLLGRSILLVWSALCLLAAIMLFTRTPNARMVAGVIAVVGLVLSLPALVGGAGALAWITAVVGAVILYLLWDKSWGESIWPILTMAFISLAGGLLFAFIQANLLRGTILFQPSAQVATVQELRVLEATQATGFLTFYYVFVFSVMIAMAFVLSGSGGRSRQSMGAGVAFAGLAVFMVLAVWAIGSTNLRVIQSDIVFKRGKPFEQNAARSQAGGDLEGAVTAWENTIAVYERAIDMTPNEDFYYLFLGRAYLERSTIENDPAERARLFTQAENRLLEAQEINPLNTDHTANLARLNTRLVQLTENETDREVRLEKAESYYKAALLLSPQNSVIRNEFAGLTFDLKRDCEEAMRLIDESAEIDPYFSDTFFTKASIYISCASSESEEAQTAYYEEAVASLEQALALEPNNARGWLQAAQLYQELERYEEALTAYDEALAADTRGQAPVWNVNFAKASLYEQLGDLELAQQLAQQALAAAPPENAAQIQQFIGQLGGGTAVTPTLDTDTGQVPLDGERPLAALNPAERNNIYPAPPPLVINPAAEYEVIINTEKGEMRLRLFPEQAPRTVNNFVFLAQQGFYDNTTFHRVIEDFMAQAGDPTGTGSGGPGYMFADETENGLTFDRPGLLAMANAGPNTNGSQFFITYEETPWLDGQHTIFGELVAGEEVLDSLTLRDPAADPDVPADVIQSIEIVELDE